MDLDIGYKYFCKNEYGQKKNLVSLNKVSKKLYTSYDVPPIT